MTQFPASDFVLCIGDDKTDEDMFNVLEVYPNAFTVMVDKKPTNANYYLEKQSDVLKLLSYLGKCHFITHLFTNQTFTSKYSL